MKMISLDAVLRLLDEDGIVFRKTVEQLPTYEIPDQHHDKNTSLTLDGVIKALECCTCPDSHACDDCPQNDIFLRDGNSMRCKTELMDAAVQILKKMHEAIVQCNECEYAGFFGDCLLTIGPQLGGCLQGKKNG